MKALARAFTLVLGLTASAASTASAQRPAERWLLVYDGDPRFNYTSAAYDRVLSGASLRGRCATSPFTGIILLALKPPHTNNWFVHWAAWAQHYPLPTGSDWNAYLDELSRPGGVLARLDSAAGRSGAGPLDVAVMLPAIDRDQSSFDFAGAQYDIHTAADRAVPFAAYIASLRLRFAELRPKHLRLTAAYWLREDVDASDTLAVPAVARIVHAAGLRFLWIPYFTSANAARWRFFGFDEAFLQPNFFFDPAIRRERIDTAVARAARAGMGLELEFDKRVLSDSVYRPRLEPYLDAYLASHPSAIAVYDGAGALSELLQAPHASATTQRVLRLLCGL